MCTYAYFMLFCVCLLTVLRRSRKLNMNFKSSKTWHRHRNQCSDTCHGQSDSPRIPFRVPWLPQSIGLFPRRSHITVKLQLPLPGFYKAYWRSQCHHPVRIEDRRDHGRRSSERSTGKAADSIMVERISGAVAGMSDGDSGAAAACTWFE